MTGSLADVPAVIARRYRVVRALGRGGMGDVVEAFDEEASRRVALKRMHAAKGEDLARGALRFRREYHTLVTLRHPRIVAAYDFGTDEGVPYYTMELLDGEDLKDLGVVPPVEACRLLRDVAAALAMLHARGLVHRDLAAKNVRRLADGRAKLLDFGILASFGVSGEVAGTPSYVAPEALRGMAIDGRADLYSLGVLAYVLLTRRVPFGGRTFDEVIQARQRAPQPPPPSAVSPDVPPALDEVVMSLLASDPAARPQAAAEVIARLSGIAKLPDDASLEVTQGYLASAALVGREEELGVARFALGRALAGEGGTVFFVAESGTGKSRLLHEVALEAKLAGALVASVSGESAAPTPYATLDDVAAALLREASEDVLAAAGTHAPTLARVVPSLRARLSEATGGTRAEDPGEERLRVQRAAAEWLRAVAARRPLVLLVDDVQRCDEASATVLAALARGVRGAKLLVVAAQRSGETPRAPGPVAALASAGKTLQLGGLDLAGVGALVRALFGDAPNASRLAARLHGATGGLPMHAMELARQLVDDGTIRYRAGLWVIPPDLPTESAPRTLADAMDARVHGLSPPTRALGEVLAVAGGTSTLDFVAALARDDGTGGTTEGSGRFAVRAFLALDELTLRGVLVGDGQSYRFQHDSLREALLRGLDAERLRALHERVGELLLAEPDADARAAEIGFHLLRGGDEARGADLLARAGKRLFDAQALADCIAPLEAALGAYEKLGRSRGRTMELRAMLLAAGWVSDRAVGSRHAMAVVRDYRTQAGLDLADRLRVLGRPLALVLGVTLATLRWLVRPGASRGPSPYHASLTFGVSLVYALGLAAAENRKEDVDALARLSDVLDAFRNRIPHAVHLVASAYPHLVHGRLRNAGECFTAAMPVFQADRLLRAGDVDRKFAECAVRGLRALVDVSEASPRALVDCDAMEALGFRYYKLVVAATRTAVHRYRGEETKARAIERGMEIPTIQLGSWSTDVQVLMFAHPAYALCHDVLGLERCAAALERLVAQGFRYEGKLALTRAEWERERGNAPRAVEILERELAGLEPDDQLMRRWVGSALAEALLAAGRPAEARDAARTVLHAGAEPHGRLVLPHLRCVRVAALADAELGEPVVARRVLDDAIAECEALELPPLAVSMHEARARVALVEGDAAAFRDHAASALRWARPTENPALLGFVERLTDAARARSPVGAPADDTAPTRLDTPHGRTPDPT